MKATVSRWLVLDVSPLNKVLLQMKFMIESPWLVLQSIQKDDWLISVDLLDRYFQVLIHPSSLKYLRFVFDGIVYQFKVICFGLCTALQVFIRVFGFIASVLHLEEIWACLYLDDWLTVASSLLGILRAKQFLIDLLAKLGFVINPTKFPLVQVSKPLI